MVDFWADSIYFGLFFGYFIGEFFIFFLSGLLLQVDQVCRCYWVNILLLSFCWFYGQKGQVIFVFLFMFIGDFKLQVFLFWDIWKIKRKYREFIVVLFLSFGILVSLFFFCFLEFFNVCFDIIFRSFSCIWQEERGKVRLFYFFGRVSFFILIYFLIFFFVQI